MPDQSPMPCAGSSRGCTPTGMLQGADLAGGTGPCARLAFCRMAVAVRAAVISTGPGSPLRLGTAVSQDMHLHHVPRSLMH